MIQVYLIRHSMTAGNLKKRYIGRTDESLCPEGIVLLESYIQKNIYPEVQRVYVSPMKRCMETAKLIFKENFYEVEELRECDFGIFENKNYKELSDCPEYQAWIDSGGTLAFPGGESREAFIARCVDGMELVMEQIRQQLAYRACPKCRETEDNGMIQEPLPVVAVVHGGTIMALLSHYCGGDYFSYQVKNAEGYHLRLSIQENKMELKEKV